MSTSSVHTTITRMPGPRSREAPRFDGRKIKKFLYEFELQANGARLSDTQKCDYIVSYCKEREAKFIRTLRHFHSKSWNELKQELLNYYPADQEDRVYSSKDLARFVKKDRKIRRRVHLDDYRRKFRVIAISLEARGNLNVMQRDDHFFRGIKPISFRRMIKRELKTQGQWQDLTRPPDMDLVVAVAKYLLKSDLYRDDESDGNFDSSEDETSDTASNSSDDSYEDDNGSSTTELEEESHLIRKRRDHRSSKKFAHKKSRKVSTGSEPPKPPETKADTSSKEPTSTSKSNMDDLADRISKLSIEVTKLKDQPKNVPQATTSSVWRCFMCSEEGHGVRDCPETKAFVAAGVLRFDGDNKLVLADGTRLPRVTGGSLANFIRQRASTRTSAATLEWLREFETASQEFGKLGEPMFEVFPAERTDKDKSKSKPYERPRDRDKSPKPNPPVAKTSPTNESKKNQSPQNRAYVEISPPTQILKRTKPEEPLEMDVDVTPPVHKGKHREEPQRESEAKSPEGPSKTKKSKGDVVIVPTEKNPPLDKTKGGPQYKFASELQDRAKSEEIFERILNQQITIPLGAVLGSSFELNKRLAAATRVHRVPVRTSLINHEMDDSEPEAEICAQEVIGTSFETVTVFSDDEVETGSVEESDLSYEVINAETEDTEERVSIEELAERVYQRMLESECNREMEVDNVVNARRPTSFLAMVTAKIQGSIHKRPCVMLIDTGSELNIMTSEYAMALELPIDPSGSAWTLRGVSGHLMALEGLCRDVPVLIGGVEVSHNFFITRDRLNGKDIILGQPWLFGHSTRIDYIQDLGMVVQVWNEGDRENGASVRIKLPILNAPRNVFPIYGTFAHTTESNALTVEPGLDSWSRKTPVFPSRIAHAFDMPEGGDLNSEELRPDELSNALIMSDSLHPVISRNLKKSWYIASSSVGVPMTTRVEKVLHSRGVDHLEAKRISERFSKAVCGAKYKPVAKKVVPVSTHDPDATVPTYVPIEISHLPELPINPPPFETLNYTGRLTEERISKIISRIPSGILTKPELDLLVFVVKQFEECIAFTDAERGTFSRKYYPDYVMRTIPHVPWQIKPLKLPPARSEEIMSILKEQVDAGKYEPSQSSYRARFFAVEKKDKSLRIVHDLQPLNAVSIRDSAPLPRIDEMLDSFAGSSIYGIFDLKSGFDSCTLASCSRDMTTFGANRLGSLRQTTLPQGYTNSPIEFQRRTTHMLGPMIPEKADVFIDDCALKGPKTRMNDESLLQNSHIRKFVWEYAQNLQEMLARICESGASVSGTKLVLATLELSMLGAIVSTHGMHVSHDVTAKLRNWPPCKNPTEVRGFLGTVGVVRRWIKDFAKIAKPLTLLTKKMAPHEFKWSNEANDAMENLKRLACQAVPIRSLDFHLAREVKAKDQRESDIGLVTIQVDSSVIGVGWVINQRFEDGIYPIVFGSLTFNDVESRYSQPKLELYGVLRALKAERHRLYGIHFRLQVDAISLVQMINSPDLPNAAMTRWITYILMFDFEIEHNPAEKHRGPDGLSRRRKAAEDSDHSDAEADPEHGLDFIKSVNDVNMEDGIISHAELLEQEFDVNEEYKVLLTRLDRRMGECIALEVKWLEPTNLKQAGYAYEGLASQPQSDDPIRRAEHAHKTTEHDSDEYWKEIISFLLSGAVPSEKKEALRLTNRARRFLIYEGTLWRRNGDNPLLQVVISQEIRLRVVKDAHDGSGHRGQDPTYLKVKDTYWWPNMYTSIAQYCRTCHECQMRSTYRNVVPIQPQYVKTLLRRFDADTVNMPRGTGGFKYLIDIVDNLTGWVEAKATKNIKSETIAKFLFEVMCRFGCIFQLTVDNGSEFQGATQTLMDRYGVPIVRTTAYNPGANGKVERGHGVWIESIWKVLQGKTNEWPSLVGYALWADRVTTKRPTGYSPYYLLYGQHPLMPFDATDRTFHALDWPSVRTTHDLIAMRIRQLSQREEFLNKAVLSTFESRKRAADAFNRMHAARMTKGEFKRGEFVLVSNDRMKTQHDMKGQLRWYGPYIVVQRLSSGAIKLQELDGTILKRPVAWKRVKLYHFRKGLEPISRKLVSNHEEPEAEDDLPPSSRELSLAKRVGLPRPWELRGKALSDYWQEKSRRWKLRRIDPGHPDLTKPEAWEKELDDFIAEDEQFWNYKDILPDIDGELPRFKTKPTGHPQIYEWNPRGSRGYFQTLRSYPLSIEEDKLHEVLTLGEPETEAIPPAQKGTEQPLTEHTSVNTDTLQPSTNETGSDFHFYDAFLLPRTFDSFMAVTERSPEVRGRSESVDRNRRERGRSPPESSRYRNRGRNNQGRHPQTRIRSSERHWSPPRTPPRQVRTPPKNSKRLRTPDKLLRSPDGRSARLIPDRPSPIRNHDLSPGEDEPKDHKKKRRVSPYRDWNERNKPWEGLPPPASDDPPDERSFIDVIREERARQIADIEKNRMDDERTNANSQFWKAMERPDHIPFIESDEDLKDFVLKLVQRMDKLEETAFKTKSEHDERMKTLYQTYSNYESLVHNLNERTTGLMTNLRASAASHQSLYDDFRFELKHTKDAARALRHLFVGLHEEALTTHEYHQIINMCLKAVRRKLEAKSSTEDLRYIAFTGALKAMWTTWDQIEALPPLWETDFIEREIDRKKEEQDIALRAFRAQRKLKEQKIDAASKKVVEAEESSEEDATDSNRAEQSAYDVALESLRAQRKARKEKRVAILEKNINSEHEPSVDMDQPGPSTLSVAAPPTSAGKKKKLAFKKKSKA